MPVETPPSLADLQARFWQYACQPVGMELPLEPLFAHVRGDDRLSGGERLEIYANMYYQRLLDVLSDQFPRVVATLGDEELARIVQDYLRALPPRHPSIDKAGDRLSQFLRTDAIGIDLPWLADLAALEWARNEVFDAADVEPLVAEELARLGDKLADLRIALIPAHRRIHASYSVEKTMPEAIETDLILWRQDLIVYHRSLDPIEAAAVDRVADGLSIGELCEWISADRSSDEATREVFALLGRWVSDGLLTRSESP